MPVNIGEINSEVIASGSETTGGGAGPAAAPGGGREWEEWDRLKQAARRLGVDHARTRAEGFDD